MSEQYRSGEPFTIEEILEIADAITSRDLQEFEASQSIASGAIGQDPMQMPAAIQQKVTTAKTAALIQRIENPEAKIDMNGSIEFFAGHVAEELAVQIHEESGEEVDKEEIKDMLASTTKILFDDLGYDSEKAAEAFAKTFNAAKNVAQEHGVSVADVYRREELYIEIFRTIYTPEGFVREQLETFDAFSEKTMNAILMQIGRTFLSVDPEDDMTQEETEKLLQEMKNDPMVAGMMRQVAEMGKQAAKHALMARVVRFWGSDALKNLPADIDEELDPENTFFHEQQSGIFEGIGGVAMVGVNPEQADILRMREAFVKSYFEERDWDVTNPTAEQIQEVRSQPGWKNPSA